MTLAVAEALNPNKPNQTAENIAQSAPMVIVIVTDCNCPWKTLFSSPIFNPTDVFKV